MMNLSNTNMRKHSMAKENKSWVQMNLKRVLYLEIFDEQQSKSLRAGVSSRHSPTLSIQNYQTEIRTKPTIFQDAKTLQN